MTGKKMKRTSNPAYKAQYATGPKKTIKNKAMKLLKHIKKHPIDKQAELSEKPNYTRRKPLLWWEALRRRK